MLAAASVRRGDPDSARWVVEALATDGCAAVLHDSSRLETLVKLAHAVVGLADATFVAPVRGALAPYDGLWAFDGTGPFVGDRCGPRWRPSTGRRVVLLDWGELTTIGSPALAIVQWLAHDVHDMTATQATGSSNGQRRQQARPGHGPTDAGPTGPGPIPLKAGVATGRVLSSGQLLLQGVGL